LGVVLYSMLTGQMPILRTAKGLRGYLEELRDSVPAPLLTVNPEAPPACAALAMRLLAKADARPQDADEVSRLLVKCHNPVTGEVIHHVVVRGTCWAVVKKLPQTLCPDQWYDPPPEVMNDADPKSAELKEACFIPYASQGRSVDP